MIPLIMFTILSSITFMVLYPYFGILLWVQYLLIMLVTIVGEQIVSSWGYYHYTDKNRFFFSNIPASIPFFWVFFIQFSLIISRLFFTSDLLIVFFSALLTLALDLVLIEPYLSRKKGFWTWIPKENGMFRFVPGRVNRFTAPFGNYFTWFVLPFLMNALLMFGVKYSGICL